MNNKPHLAQVMNAVLAFAPEATAREESDGNIVISLNMRLQDNDYLVSFETEYDLTGEDI
jgi:hypothetical protein